jgi:hypothetical protein
MNHQQTLKICFTNALGAGTSGDLSQLSFGSAAWDSVAHIALVTEIETQFGVELTPEDITDLTSYPAAENILTRHGITIRG